MHHLEAIAVKHWSYKAESPPSTLRCTSRDIQTGFMRKSGSGLRSIAIGWEDMIPPSVDDPCNCMDPHLGQIEWDQKLGKIECVFSLYNKMRWKWDDVYLLRGLQNIYSPSLYSPPLTLYIRTPAITPEWCTQRLWLSVFGDAVWGRDRVNLEAVIGCIWRFTWRLWSSELRDALRDRDWASLEIHLEAMILQTWRSWLCEFGRCNGESLEMHLEAVIMRTWRL